MGAKSEFQRVLEKHLGPQAQPSAHPRKETQSNLQEDFLDQIKFTFSPLGKIKTSAAYPKKTESSPPKFEDKKIVAEAILAPKPRPIVKRKLTFDQVKALKVFSKYSTQVINEFSSDEEIKAEYRKLAKIYHPDVNKNGAESFKLISLAYSKLIK